MSRLRRARKRRPGRGKRLGVFPRADRRAEKEICAGQGSPGSGGRRPTGRCIAGHCRYQSRAPGNPSGDPARRHGRGHGTAGTCHSSEKDDCPASSCERHEGRAGDRYRGSSRYRAGSRVRVCRTGGLTTGSEAFCWSVRCGGGSIRAGRGSASLRRTAESRLPCRACPHFRWARPQEGCCDRSRIRGGSRSDHSAGTGTTACGTSHGCGGTGCRSGSSGGGIRTVVIGRRSGGAARGR